MTQLEHAQVHGPAFLQSARDIQHWICCVTTTFWLSAPNISASDWSPACTVLLVPVKYILWLSLAAQKKKNTQKNTHTRHVWFTSCRRAESLWHPSMIAMFSHEKPHQVNPPRYTLLMWKHTKVYTVNTKAYTMTTYTPTCCTNRDKAYKSTSVGVFSSRNHDPTPKTEQNTVAWERRTAKRSHNTRIQYDLRHYDDENRATVIDGKVSLI